MRKIQRFEVTNARPMEAISRERMYFIFHISYLRKINFTLIELLIVIAIIAILAGMLLPALNKARDMGRSIACINQERQMGLTVQTYANGNDDFIVPPSYIKGAGTGDQWLQNFAPAADSSAGWNYGWLKGTPAHVKNLFICKANLENLSWGSAYAYNTRLGYNAYNTSYRPYKISQLKEVTKVMILADNGRSTAVCFDYSMSQIGFPHSNRCNVLLADGHVESQSKTLLQYNYNKYIGWMPR